jgi:hypothetical protein
MTMGSEDENGDTCLISSSGFFLGRGIAIEVSRIREWWHKWLP